MSNTAEVPHAKGTQNTFIDIQGGFQETQNKFSWSGSFFHKVTHGPVTVSEQEQFVVYLNTSTVRSELGENFFDSFQEYQITHGELVLFDITTPEDKAQAGVVYMAPYPWSTYDGKTLENFNVKALPGVQWKPFSIPSTNWATSNKFPVGSICNGQMLTIKLENPAYFLDTYDLSNTERGTIRNNSWQVTNSGGGPDSSRWYGFIIDYERYSAASGSSAVSSVSFHFILKYNISLRGYRPVTTNTSRKNRSLYEIEDAKDSTHIYSKPESFLTRYEDTGGEDTGASQVKMARLQDSVSIPSTTNSDIQDDEIQTTKSGKD